MPTADKLNISSRSRSTSSSSFCCALSRETSASTATASVWAPPFSARRTEDDGQPTVLVVDDDTGLQSMFKLFLKKQGFSRIVVGSGKDALAALHKHKFELCFLDLQLPDTTGDEVYKQAKQIQPGLPIVIITGYPDSQTLDNILKHGPVTVLKKPLEVEALQQTLRLLGHKVNEKVKAA